MQAKSHRAGSITKQRGGPARIRIGTATNYETNAMRFDATQCIAPRRSFVWEGSQMIRRGIVLKYGTITAIQQSRRCSTCYTIRRDTTHLAFLAEPKNIITKWPAPT